MFNCNSEESDMYEYKVDTYKVKVAENEMNKMALEGWRVIAVSPNEAV